jgi:hypothetical protein
MVHIGSHFKHILEKKINYVYTLPKNGFSTLPPLISRRKIVCDSINI